MLPPMSPDEIAVLDAALEKHGGNREKARGELGLTYDSLKEHILKNPGLNLKWGRDHGTETAVEPAKLVQSEVVASLAVETPEVLEKRAETSFQRLLGEVTGPDENALKLSRQLLRMYGEHLCRCADLVGGHLVNRALKLDRQNDELDQELREGDFSGEGGALRYEAMSKKHTDNVDLMIKVGLLCQRGLVAKAKVEALKGGGKGGAGKGKLAWGPKQTNILANTVNLNGKAG